jgi:Prealbumin-like fold domain
MKSIVAPLSSKTINKTGRRTVRVISIGLISLGLIWIGSSASARFAVKKFVNKAVTTVRGPSKTKPTLPKRNGNKTPPVNTRALPSMATLLSPQSNEASVSTDKLHYEPGETVRITGSGFSANERVTLQVRHHDRRVEVGPAYDPWDVQANAAGEISSSWMVNPQEIHGSWLEVRAKGADSGLFTMVFFTDPASADLDQCGNGPASAPVPCTLDAWQNGNLNANQAHYGEGDSVPYRMKFDQLQIGGPNTVTISYDTTKGGTHALDYLTDYDRTESTGNNPCSGIAGCNLVPESTFPIPIDPRVTNGQNQVPGGGDDIVQIPGSFSLFGGTITAVSAYTVSGSYAGDSTTSITITFTSSVTNPVLAWGGHIATRLNWGITNSAIAIPGSPYHTRLEDLNGGGGNQDRSLSAGAVFFPISVTIVKVTDPDDAQTKTFNYTTTGTDLSAFSLTPPNGITSDSKNFILNDDSTRTVTESDPHASPPEFNLTNIACVQTDGGLGVGTFSTSVPNRNVSFSPDEGQSITCTFTNVEDQNVTRGKIIVDKVTNPGSDTTSFDFTTSFGSPFSLTNAATPKDSGLIMPGTYTVSESANSDYLTTATCTSSLGHPADDPSSINLAAGEVVTCTFTNAKKPKLTVTKIVVNDNGGTKQISDFPLFVDGNSVTSGVKNTSTVGSHSVSETTDSGYAATIGGDCAADGSITLAAGDDKACTITNDDKAAKLIVIKHVINDNGGTATAANFTLDSGGSNDSPDNFAGAESPGTEVTLHAGAYNVSESGPSGYTASYSADCSGPIANGKTKTCTVTNDDQAAKLIVIKHVINDNGGTATAANFTLDSGGSNDSPDNFAGAESPGTEVTLDAGSYNVTESGPTGYTASYSADCSGSIANGQMKTCTVTNDDKAAKLIVIKHVINDNGGTATAANFTLDSGGTNDSPDNFAGAESPGTEVTLDAGSYNVSESGPSGYTASYSAYCSGTIANGQTKTCTVTNNDQAAKLIVIKHVINDNGGTATAANFTLDSGGTNDSPDNFAGAESPGTEVTLDAGSYNVTESGPSGYAASYSAYCSGTIANGQTRTCTVTNNDISPTLRVIKDVVPDTDSGLFNLQIDGATAGTGANAGDGGSTGFVPVNAGNHSVGETAGTNTTLSDYTALIGGDCAANGAVSLALAQNKTCTITNTKKGMAQIVKTVSGLPPAAGQTFTFEIRQGASTVSDGTVLESKTTDASGNLNFTTKLVAGQTYQMCEWVFPGWNTNLAGDGPLFVPNSLIPPALPNPNVNNLTVCTNFSVQPGQTRTLTVNNSPPPGGRALTIGFWKNWASCANSNGKGQKPMLDLALGIASLMTTNPPGGLVASAQNPGALWPNYAALWYLVLKGNSASTANNILPAPDCAKARNLLDKTTIDGGKKMSSDPLFNMTAQLIAAELNRFMGAGINGTTIMNIDRAVLLNGKYKFNGLTYTPKLTTADANLANCLATQLDNYNNGRPVGLCP